jgi:hypothetical protein
MKIVACDSWPLVLPNDDGIRPAGPPDACFYCRRLIGNPHGPECETVLVLVRYQVKMTRDYKVITAVYEDTEPYFWGDYDGNFYRNESSWCTGNALIKWSDGTESGTDEYYFRAGSSCHNECLCDTDIEFYGREVLDPRPHIQLRNEE